MVDVAPMRGLRYSREFADERVLAPPYDVIGPELQRRLLDQSPFNVVRLILGADPTDTEWHARAAETLARWIADGVLVRDIRPVLYGYQQRYLDPEGCTRTRTGLIGRVRLSPYGGAIHRHEHTRIGPRVDRLRLTRAVRANLSPVFGLYRDPRAELSGLLVPPHDPLDPNLLFDVVDDEGVRQILWRICDLDTMTALTAGLADRDVIIADGHHRYETALAYQAERREAEGDPPEAQAYDYVLMYLAAAEDPGLCVLPTHRIVTTPQSIDVPRLLAALEEDFELTRVSDGTPLSMAAEAAQDHTVAIGACFGGAERWVLRLRDLARAHQGRRDPDVELAELDVTVLQSLILDRRLGIDAEALARTDQVAYTIDEHEACARVATGEAQAAFILNPTRLEQVWRAATRGLTMPQKSTYFYPKLATGLVINPLDEH